MGSSPQNSLQKLNRQEKKQLIYFLEDAYNVDLKHLLKNNFFKAGKEKIYISTIDPQELNLDNINSIGLYFGVYHGENTFRLSIEGSQLIENPKKNYLILKNDSALTSYLAAKNLFEEDIDYVSNEVGTPFLIVIFKNQHIGCVSVKDNYYLSYMPKSRKLDYNKVF